MKSKRHQLSSNYIVLTELISDRGMQTEITADDEFKSYKMSMFFFLVWDLSLHTQKTHKTVFTYRS